MKFLLHLPGKEIDTSGFFERFPGHELVKTGALEAASREIPDAEVLIINSSSYDRPFADMVKADQRALKWIQFTTSGIDPAIHAGGFPPGVVVTNAAGLSAPFVAEHAISLLLMVARRYRETEAARLRRDWIRDQLREDMGALTFRTMCIVGMGAVGHEVARRARGFSMRVLGVSRAAKPGEFVDEVYPRERLAEALAEADFVTICLPATADTIDFFGAEALAAMKPTAVLANISRGDVVDEDALIAACRDRTIAGAGLDVAKVEPLPAQSPLWALDNVVITPHVAGGGGDTSERLLELVYDNIGRYLAGKPLNLVVDVDSYLPA